MKVLTVNFLLDPVSGGGTAERTVQLSRHLAGQGVECTALTLDIGLSPSVRERLRPARVEALGVVNRRFYAPRPSGGLIDRLVREADVVHVMNHWTALNACVYLAARRHAKPYALCPAGTLPIYGRSKLLKRFYNAAIGRRLVADASAHIAVTPAEIPHFQSYGVAPERITVIPNGIDLSDYELHGPARWTRPGAPGRPFILFLGRLNHIKGPDLLLDAFAAALASLPDYDLVFAGPDSGMLGQLEATATAKGLADRVHFVGYLGGRDKAEALAAADLLVIPSRQEAMSIVVLEAGATGTPVLLTDACGFDELADLEPGCMVEASAEAIARGLRELTGDRGRLAAWGERLRRHVRERYAWEAIIDRYLSLFAEMAERGRPRA